ncbi:MAG: VWA domain-containing protein [Bryobacteraceae bacterium]|nr:VWA domain-containing protein [Bryobacteraceae bacterium]
MTLRRFAPLIFVCVGSLAQEPVFKTGVNLVRVDVEVLSGRDSVRELSAQDFVVRDQGKTVHITHCAREEAPLDLMLLFDISGSMKPAVTAVAQGSRRALSVLRPGDRVAVSVVHGEVRRISELTGDLRDVEAAIRFGVLAQRFVGATHLQEGILIASVHLSAAGRSERRRAVLLITDNEGDRTMDDEEAIDAAWKADTVVCGLVVKTGQRTPRGKKPVDKIAEKTGCEMMLADSPEEGFVDMIRRLRSRYVLYYPLPATKPGERRDVEVELSREARSRAGNPRVFARKGYIAPDGGASN